MRWVGGGWTEPTLWFAHNCPSAPGKTPASTNPLAFVRHTFPFTGSHTTAPLLCCPAGPSVTPYLDVLLIPLFRLSEAGAGGAFVPVYNREAVALGEEVSCRFTYTG